MKKKIFSFTVLFSAVMFNVGFVQAQARPNYDSFQRQQQQQRIWEQQRQQQQQMREQQRQQMERMRQDAQEQMRRKFQEQQRLQQQQMRQGIKSGTGNVTPFRGTMNNRSGFTGKSTKDGRALAVINNRMLAVPNARAGLRASNDNFRKAQTARLTNAQRAIISAEVRKLATASLGDRGRTGGAGGLTGKFNSAAGGGNRRRGNRGGSGGGGDGSGGNGPSGPKKGDLTGTFNDAAGSKKRPPEKPAPRPTPPTPKGPGF